MFCWCLSVLGLVIGNYVAFVFLLGRQMLRLLGPAPKDSREIFSEEEYDKAKTYNMDKIALDIAQRTFSFLKIVLVFRYLLLFQLDGYLRGVFPKASPAAFAAIFLNVFMAAEYLTNVPFDLVQTFLVEERHGFNKMDFVGYCSDLMKEMVLCTIVSSFMGYFGFRIISSATLAHFFYFWVFAAAFSVLLCIAFPVVIDPFFNKFTLLEDGKLKSLVEELARKVQFPLSKILVMDGSKRSTHTNAYFVGICGERRIVFYDTLLKNSTNEQVLAALCHEFGHWHHLHMLKLMVIHQAILLGIVMLAGMVILEEAAAKVLLFGAEVAGDVPIHIKVLYCMMLCTHIGLPVSVLKVMISRAFERQADAFAVEQGHGESLISALKNISKDNKSNPNPDPWYAAVCYSHPTVTERMSAITRLVHREPHKAEKEKHD